jgi:hypothetical protein
VSSKGNSLEETKNENYYLSSDCLNGEEEEDFMEENASTNKRTRKLQMKERKFSEFQTPAAKAQTPLASAAPPTGFFQQGKQQPKRSFTAISLYPTTRAVDSS